MKKKFIENHFSTDKKKRRALYKLGFSSTLIQSEMIELFNALTYSQLKTAKK